MFSDVASGLVCESLAIWHDVVVVDAGEGESGGFSVERWALCFISL